MWNSQIWQFLADIGNKFIYFFVLPRLMLPQKKKFNMFTAEETEKFVNSMVESSKKTYDTPKPNECKEELADIEKLTKRIKDGLSRS
jgi:hypothetical protein